MVMVIMESTRVIVAAIPVLISVVSLIVLSAMIVFLPIMQD